MPYRLLKRAITVFVTLWAAASLAAASPAAAQSTTPQAVATPFDEDGYALTATVTPKECLVVSSIDLGTMVAKTSDLQAKGLIRPDVTPAHVKAHAWTTASVFALKVEPLFVVTVFKNSPEIALCHFGQAFVDFDGKPQIAFTFSLTRAMYDKVDWSNFTPTDLPSVVQNFTLGPDIAQHMRAESKLNDQSQNKNL
jgi:hypothetical protein